MPHPGGRLQSLPRPRRLARLRPGRHCKEDGTAGSLRRRHLRGQESAARSVFFERSRRCFCQERLRQTGLQRGSRRALRALLPQRGGGLRQGGHRLGTREVFRAHMKLKDKVALITGAGSGIGRQSALLFAQEGAAVVAVDVNEQAARDTAAAIPNAIAVRADVAKAGDCERMVAEAEKRFGRLDVLFNNAGIMHGGDDDAVATAESVWDLTLEVNAKGVFLGCKYGIPALRRAGGGSVINTASFVARMGAATPQIAYTASKGAVLAMTRELAVIHARENIRVNALSPGPLRTDLLMRFLDTEQKKQRRLVHVPMGRFGEAEEIARAALFLACDESSYVTGTEFLVDGGLTAAYVTPE